jgi:hypothetical protein
MTDAVIVHPAGAVTLIIQQPTGVVQMSPGDTKVVIKEHARSTLVIRSTGPAGIGGGSSGGGGTLPDVIDGGFF